MKEMIFKCVVGGKRKCGDLAWLSANWGDVDGESVRLFTGLTDADGNKIFDGDTLIWTDDDGASRKVEVGYVNGCFVINASSGDGVPLSEALALGMKLEESLS